MELKELIGNLSAIAEGKTTATERDKQFADSLINGKYGFKARGFLTDGQKNAGFRMVDKIQNPPPVEHTVSLEKVYAFIKQAREHLKFPKLMLQMGGKQLKVYMSGSRSKIPNAINLVTEDEWGNLDLWLGCVLESGEWQHRRGNEELHKQAAALLTELAEDPVKVATDHGHLTGNCCFCNKGLTDQRSTDIGYGPVCARKWNLPWGSKA